ncbi:hypothetical protein [Nocardia sp. NPDC006630]|uniref:hypothetical protein n=1 Tax=Nocardia sp. NPDC006630 TaxID=3157181 RepID=UPI0033B7FE4A
MRTANIQPMRVFGSGNLCSEVVTLEQMYAGYPGFDQEVEVRIETGCAVGERCHHC